MLEHQKITICGFRIHQYFWFMLSGAIGDVIQACLDFLVYTIYTMEWERATVCWTVSYVCSIVFRHTIHRYIVFGEAEGTYCNSLGRTYMAYASSIVLSMLSNHFISDILRFSHREAWVITMLWTGIMNYFILRATWKTKKTTKDDKDTLPTHVSEPSTKITV